MTTDPKDARIMELEAALGNAIAVMREELKHVIRIKRGNHHTRKFERINHTMIACDKVLRGMK